MKNTELIKKLDAEKALSREEWWQLIGTFTDGDREFARSIAQGIALERFGRGIFFRGIVEFTNFCKNDCLYCGIRRDDRGVQRYRLEKDDIMVEDGGHHGCDGIVKLAELIEDAAKVPKDARSLIQMKGLGCGGGCCG